MVVCLSVFGNVSKNDRKSLKLSHTHIHFLICPINVIWQKKLHRHARYSRTPTLRHLEDEVSWHSTTVPFVVGNLRWRSHRNPRSVIVCDPGHTRWDPVGGGFRKSVLNHNEHMSLYWFRPFRWRITQFAVFPPHPKEKLVVLPNS